MTYIIYPEDDNLIDQLGGKAKSLATLNQFAFAIPPWFMFFSGLLASI